MGGPAVQGDAQVGVIVAGSAQVGSPMQTQPINAPQQMQFGSPTPMQVPSQQPQYAPQYATPPPVNTPPAIVYQQQPAVVYNTPAPTTIIYENRPHCHGYYGCGYGGNFGGTDPLLAGGLGFGAGLLAG